MSEFKNQHYVPAFLLRHFSTDKKSVGILDVLTDWHHETASIKSQCSKDWFYTNDGRNEPIFREAEGKASAFLKELMASRLLPKPGTVEFYQLSSFVLFQLGRTMGAKANTEASFDLLAKAVLREHFTAKGDQELLDYLPKVGFEFNETAMHLVVEHYLASPLLSDMQVCLICSGGSERFVLGDDPVILTNAFYFDENRNPMGGFASRGLIVFMPISPMHQLILYDPTVYKTIGDKDRIEVVADREVVMLNELQVLNCLKNVYFDILSNISLTRAKARSLAHVKRTRLHDIKVQGGYTDEQGRKGKLLTYSGKKLTVPKELILFKIRRSAKRGLFSKGDGFVRDPGLAATVRNIMKDPKSFRNLFP